MRQCRRGRVWADIDFVKALASQEAPTGLGQGLDLDFLAQARGLLEVSCFAVQRQAFRLGCKRFGRQHELHNQAAPWLQPVSAESVRVLS